MNEKDIMNICDSVNKAEIPQIVKFVYFAKSKLIGNLEYDLVKEMAGTVCENIPELKLLASLFNIPVAVSDLKLKVKVKSFIEKILDKEKKDQLKENGQIEQHIKEILDNFQLGFLYVERLIFVLSSHTLELQSKILANIYLLRIKDEINDKDFIRLANINSSMSVEEYQFLLRLINCPIVHYDEETVKFFGENEYLHSLFVSKGLFIKNSAHWDDGRRIYGKLSDIGKLLGNCLDEEIKEDIKRNDMFQ